MAAGNSSRFGSNKLSAEFQGKSLIAHTLDTVPEHVFDTVVVVTQYAPVETLARDHGFDVVKNMAPALGLSHTVALGTAHLQACDAILYLVGDQPLLRGKSIARIVGAWRDNPEKIVGASHGSRRGNPCIFPKHFFSELLALEGDVGGSMVIKRHEDSLLLVEVPRQELLDIDTKESFGELGAE